MRKREGRGKKSEETGRIKEEAIVRRREGLKRKVE